MSIINLESMTSLPVRCLCAGDEVVLILAVAISHSGQ